MTIELTVGQLRGLIGRRVEHEGATCQVIEILEDGPSLVLRCTDAQRVIQPNQYGEPHRRVPRTYTIPVLSPDQRGFSPAFLSLDLVETDAGAQPG